ncbi:molybdenum cofactor guanylyltransferase [Sunxiuqinia elliptica]|uniref:Probable molybdenum cofactor guanylyltransferase n=1 Tax=Sunxiuqinia elliptica TaxID=655355 RepID=A0A4R6GM14_9BACT|nr:molybdenum cofactor guanylyltransferase [Sunxiuqinia elliptica]TDN96221.1 molybdenum cofactor guanylyltransferase [Sunxiuqinia elliptica]TDO67932.1 molybdenum cofactor guanylyltransferase [Sunxiuqinia elliptica]
MALSGIILAGGKSSRMGQDKGLVDFQGKRMVEYAIDLLSPYCDELLISVNQPGYENFGLKLVADQYPNFGPIGGLHASLKEAKNEWSLVVGCDMPFLTPEFVELLLSEQINTCGVVPVHERGLEPMAAMYHNSLGPQLETYILKGSLKLQQVFRELPVSFVDVTDLLKQSPKLFANLNHPSDLETW